jgi:carbon monoxide dehydrogenase subunit G
MQFNGSVNFDAPREKVWEFLKDPLAVGRCAPGMKSVEIIEPEKQFRVLAGISFGTVNVSFDTTVDLVELEPPSHSKVRAHGKAPGSAVDISGDMYLSDIVQGGTRLDWQADVVVVGTIASLASRLMGGVTRKLSDAFFDCLKKQIESGSAGPQGAA